MDDVGPAPRRPPTLWRVPPIDRPRATAALVGHVIGTDPFRVADALALGLTRGALRAAVAAGTLVQLRQGVLSVPRDGAGLWEAARHEALAALAALGPGAVVARRSAGLLLRMPTRTPQDGPTLVEITAPQRGRRRAGIHVAEGLVQPEDRVDVDGVPCTSVARTALDLARGRPLHEALVVIDHALATAGPLALAEAFHRLPDGRGLQHLASAIAVCSAVSESPLESASRGAMLAAGLPAPLLQQWIVDDTGRGWRVDFLWPDQRVVGEADGWGKYASIADLRAEKRREDALRRAGWTVVRWTSDELWGSPDVVLQRLRAALRPR